ncbi:MAG: lytic transglycosylase domain-containing protein [Clostridia bacterium]|nr:lytic transglycosylase domain-containing protein [Clostridia bacterium]
MNNQSPAPHRRRRRPQQPVAEEVFVPTPAVRPLPGEKKRKRKRRSSSVIRIPRAVQIAIAFVLAAVLLTASVAITQNYLEAQEERRRLEAEAAERAQHPLYFEDWIRQYADTQSIDPALIASIILCESSYDPQAVSRLGARGLMQLMEDTAQWVAHKLDEDDASYSFDRLFDPETNIRFGSWYLGYLSRRFNGDAKKIVCAYHAGQGNVDSWLKNPEYSSDGVTLDKIPTQDTANYAGRVLRAIEVYHKYYFPPELPQDGDSSPQSGY